MSLYWNWKLLMHKKWIIRSENLINTLKILEKCVKYLLQVTAETMVHAFISTKLDYANALLCLILVSKQIIFKVLLMTFKCKNGIGPKYLTDLLICYDSGNPRRSEASALLRIPRTKQVTYGIPAKPLHNSDTVSVNFNHFYCMGICDKLSRHLYMLTYIYLNVDEWWLTSSMPYQSFKLQMSLNYGKI